MGVSIFPRDIPNEVSVLSSSACSSRSNGFSFAVSSCAETLPFAFFSFCLSFCFSRRLSFCFSCFFDGIFLAASVVPFAPATFSFPSSLIPPHSSSRSVSAASSTFGASFFGVFVGLAFFGFGASGSASYRGCQHCPQTAPACRLTLYSTFPPSLTTISTPSTSSSPKNPSTSSKTSGISTDFHFSSSVDAAVLLAGLDRLAGLLSATAADSAGLLFLVLGAIMFR